MVLEEVLAETCCPALPDSLSRGEHGGRIRNGKNEPQGNTEFFAPFGNYRLNSVSLCGKTLASVTPARGSWGMISEEFSQRRKGAEYAEFLFEIFLFVPENHRY